MPSAVLPRALAVASSRVVEAPLPLLLSGAGSTAATLLGICASTRRTSFEALLPLVRCATSDLRK